MDIVANIGRGLIGIIVMIGIAYLFSRDRKAINWRLVITGLGLQFVIAALLLTDIPVTQKFFQGIADGFVTIVGFAQDGSKFVFGGLGIGPGQEGSMGFFFAFQILPIIIFFSALTSALYYLGILQVIVKGFAYVMSKTMRLSGAESISAAGNVFLGQTEAPLLVKPYIAGMTRSEIMCLMVGGMATIAGSVMAAYITMLGGTRDIALQFLTASLMNAPAAIVVAKMLLPETNKEGVNTDLNVSSEKIGANFIDAIANGTSEGLKLALNVAAMLIAFVALIYMVNGLFEWIGTMQIGDFSINEHIRLSTRIVKETLTDGSAVFLQNSAGEAVSTFDGLSLQYLVGQVFRFLALAVGIEWGDSLFAGSLLGTKVIVNEFLAFDALANVPATHDIGVITSMDWNGIVPDFTVGTKHIEGVISEKTRILATFGLCGFANFSSIAIQIAGIGGIAPNQRVTLSQLGLLSVVGGTLASLMSACWAGIFLG